MLWNICGAIVRSSRPHQNLVFIIYGTVEKDVSDLIDQLVKDQVAALLPEHIKPELIQELERHERELAEVERDLHNSWVPLHLLRLHG